MRPSVLFDVRHGFVGGEVVDLAGAHNGAVGVDGARPHADTAWARKRLEALDAHGLE